MSKKKMQAARERIQAKDYAGARRILKTVDHPKAREWEDKIDRIAPPKSGGGRRLIAIMVVLLVIIVAAAGGILVILNTQPAAAPEPTAVADNPGEPAADTGGEVEPNPGEPAADAGSEVEPNPGDAGDDPISAARTFMQAVLNNDIELAATLMCQAELGGFTPEDFTESIGPQIPGVEIDPSPLEYSVVSQSGDRAEVQVAGQVRVVMEAADTEVLTDFTAFTLTLRDENGWKLCPE